MKLPKSEKKNQRNGMKSPRSDQVSLEKKQQRSGMKLPKSEQLGYEKKQQSSGRKRFGSENSARLDKKKLRSSKRLPGSPRMKQPGEGKLTMRRRSTGMVYTSLESQLRSQQAEHLLHDNWSKSQKKPPKTPPRTEHVSVKNNQTNSKRSKTVSNSENIKRRQLRRRASQPKTKISESKPWLLKSQQSSEFKHSKRSAMNGYETSTREEPRPFGISRAVRSSSVENHYRRNQTQSIQHPIEMEKRRRSSRK